MKKIINLTTLPQNKAEKYAKRVSSQEGKVFIIHRYVQSYKVIVDSNTIVIKNH